MMAPTTAPPTPPTAAPTEKLLAYAARIVGDDARTRIVLDFDAKPDFEVRYIASPDRIVIDLPATAFGFSADSPIRRDNFTQQTHP